MSTTDTSHAEFVETLRRLNYARHFNAILNPTTSHPDVPASERAIFEKITPNGQRFIFTASGFTFPGHGFIPYQDVERTTWRSDPSDQTKDYQNYLVVVFHARPPLEIYLGGSAESVPLGGLIMMMKVFKIKTGQLS